MMMMTKRELVVFFASVMFFFLLAWADMARAFDWGDVEDAVVDWWQEMPQEERDALLDNFGRDLADLGRDLEMFEDDLLDTLVDLPNLPVRPGVGYGQLFFLGDSVLFGSFPNRTGHDAAPTLLMRQSLVWNVSQNGQTLREAVKAELWRTVRWALDQSRSSVQASSAIIMALGGNDAFFYGAEGLEQFRGDLSRFLGEVDGLGADVFCMPVPTAEGPLVLAVPVYGDYLLALAEVAAAGMCAMIPTYDWGFTDEHFDDGVHLNIAGHRKLAEMLSEFLGL